MIKQKTIFLLIAIGMFIFAINQQPDIQKMAVADLEGKTCSVDKDCPCSGKMIVNGVNTTNYGIGHATCEEGKCDISFCADIEPVGTWLKDNPLHYLITNVWFTLIIVIFIVARLMWPKQ